MANSVTWVLKRYGRFVPGSEGTDGDKWKVFEADGSHGELVLTVLDSGHMLVSRGTDLVDGISLIGATEFLKVQRKTDNLLFRCSIKGESRIMRMQFAGGSKAEALERCSSAVAKLTKYLPVTTQDDMASPPPCAPAPPNQPPDASPTHTEQTARCTAGRGEPEAIHGSLSIQRLAQHFIGEQGLSLPLVYRHSPLPVGNLEAFLRACLLDSSFPAFVEEVEAELMKLLQA